MEPGLARIALATALLLLGAATAGADSDPDPAEKRGAVTMLAPPRPCAEPRNLAAGVGASSFSVVGPLRNLFNPLDVAAGPRAPSQPRPAASALPRPGSCDTPGSGCGLTPGSRVGNPPIVPGGRPGP